MSSREAPGTILRVGLQVAQKFFLFDTRKKAVALFCFICILSMVSSFITFPEDVYIVQKHSVFNQYGVKIGWFWTWVVLAPFIYFTAKVTSQNPLPHVLRLIIATFLWYSCIDRFHWFFHMTSKCDINTHLDKKQCSEQRGFDISGHCFLMVYSMLIMAEEAKNWNRLREEDKEKFKTYTQIAQFAFIGMFLLSMLWVKQLTISVLYYHIWIDKVAGVLFAIGCWAITYRVLYRKFSGLFLPPNE